MEMDEMENTGFADDADIPPYAKSAIASLFQAGLVSGHGNNRYEPNASATRAEAVAIIMNLLHSRK
ncbi:hypothetical protein D3C80_2206710 [compost metagenome]